MSGDWQGEGEHAALQEHYSSAEGGTILGTSREIVDGVSTHREFLLFEQDHQAVRLTVIVPNRRNIVFTLRSAGDGEFLFETDEEPRERLVFRRLPEERLHITLEKDGGRTWQFHLHRV